MLTITSDDTTVLHIIKKKDVFKIDKQADDIIL